MDKWGSWMEDKMPFSAGDQKYEIGLNYCVFCEFVTFPLVSWVRCGT